MDNEALDDLNRRIVVLEGHVQALSNLVDILVKRVEELEGEIDSDGPFTI